MSDLELCGRTYERTDYSSVETASESGGVLVGLVSISSCGIDRGQNVLRE